MDTLSPLELALGLAVMVLFVVVVLLVLRGGGKSSGEDSGALAARLDEIRQSHAELKGALSSMSTGAENSRSSLEKSVNERLDAVTQRVGHTLNESQQKTGETLRQLHERLAIIDGAQKNIQALTGEVNSLQALLSNKQSRGAFGEIQMQDLVKNFLPASAYEFQCTLSNNARVDCLIKLPNPPGSIAVDSKFPLEASRAYAEAEDAAARVAAGRALKTAMAKHVKDISEKYAIPGETADVTLLFLPSEAVYATLHVDFPDVIEASFKAKVMIVSPTTFMATLNTMRAVMKDARMREAAGVIQQEVGRLGEDVTRLDDRVGKLQTHFRQADDDIRQIRISTDKVVKRAERIEEVQLEDVEADALGANAKPGLAAE